MLLKCVGDCLIKLRLPFVVSEMVLDWPTRVKVASGAARGIAYLHEDCKY